MKTADPIRARTKEERMALLVGFAMAFEMVEKNGVEAARAQLKLMLEMEEGLDE